MNDTSSLSRMAVAARRVAPLAAVGAILLGGAALDPRDGMTTAGAQASRDAPEEGFREPTARARPRVWWHWMNGSFTVDGTTADLQWMKGVVRRHPFAAIDFRAFAARGCSMMWLELSGRAARHWPPAR